MAYANNAGFGYQQTHPDSAIDTKPSAYFDENAPGLMENALMSADIMRNPERAHVRKGSFANNHAVVSPAQHQSWNPHYCHPLTVDPLSAGPFSEPHHGFSREPSQAHTFGHPVQSQTWSYDHHSGTCTPTTAMNFEHPPPNPQFDAPYLQRADSARGSFSHPASATAFHVPEESFIAAPQVQTPMSPHSHQDWMNLAAQEAENRPMPKRMGGQSPPRTGIDAQRRGDGVRKKNTRIDIPHERSIQNIEELIENTTDEDLLKELKQQKRLLRNREAALASRQRKKKHTEDLETQQKDFSSQVQTLQHQIDTLQSERQSYIQNCQILDQQLQEFKRVNEALQQESRKAEMEHTKETAQLRKRIQLLTEDGPAPAMSAQPSNASFATFNAGMEALNMGAHEWDDRAHDWDDLIFNDLHSDSLDDFGFDSKSEPSRPPSLIERSDPQSSALLPSSKRSSDNAADHQVSSGLLFFLLLCGAFVASKPASSQPPDLPQVPPDIRAAAPTVLNSLLSDNSGIITQVTSQPSRATDPEPGTSSLPVLHRKPRSRLDHMHHRLTAPTRQQEIDSAFSLTPAQYASISNMDCTSDNERISPDHQDATPRPRRILAETLASMQEEHTRNSKAEVYTRSLLWDQIPADVVRQFKEMVRDHNEIEARQQRGTNDDEMIAYKVEP